MKRPIDDKAQAQFEALIAEAEADGLPCNEFIRCSLAYTGVVLALNYDGHDRDRALVEAYQIMADAAGQADEVRH